MQFGWREIEVVYEDLGRSAAGLVTRSGFERMVADTVLIDQQMVYASRQSNDRLSHIMDILPESLVALPVTNSY